MSAINWSKIDDYEFVKLIGDLIARLGFVDIDYQGDGPDGGIDLFATELLPFAVQGRVPFRWAIQCKFSVKGSAAAVNDSDVRDVEGILRSDRYLSQDARGYMLVTNRRITQNVVERLRGIDRRSQFRATRIDGFGLETMLSEQFELIDRYFGGGRTMQQGFGYPLVIIPPPAGGTRFAPPTILVELINEQNSLAMVEKTRAILDTGSAMSIIPIEVARKLLLNQTGTVQITSPSQDCPTEIPKFLVQIGIERIGRFSIEALAVGRDTVLLGRDILGSFGIFIRPDGGVDLYKE